MKFGTFPIAEAEGLILAHRARLPGRVLKKGHVLNSEDVEQLRADGVETIIGARISENSPSLDPLIGRGQPHPNRSARIGLPLFADRMG